MHPSPSCANKGEAMIDTETRKLTDRIGALETELQFQKDLVAELLKRIYGAKSEKIDTAQLLLDLLGEEAKKPEAADVQDPEDVPAADSETEKKKPSKPRSQKLRDSLKGLPTVTTEIIPSQVLADPDDYRRIGQDVSERLEISPSSLIVRITVRPTYVKKGDPEAKPTTAPLPAPLLEGSVLSASLGAHLLTEKFCYHQPFWRQEWKLRATHGIEISRNTMCNWHNHLADQLLPVYNLIATRLRESDYIKVDETPINYLNPGTGKTSTGQFWIYHHAEHGVLYDWHTSRANTCLDRILIGRPGDNPFNGWLQSDGLRAYQTFITRHFLLCLIAVSCLAHIRRKFLEAKGDHPKLAAWILYQIGKIYEIERKISTRKRNACQACS